MHFASGPTKFAETWKPQKRQLQTCWRYSATNVAIYYIINEINKNRSKLKPCSAKVGREKTGRPQKCGSPTKTRQRARRNLSTRIANVLTALAAMSELQPQARVYKRTRTLKLKNYRRKEKIEKYK